MALVEKVYLNRDNTIKLGLVADGVAVNANTLTRVVMKLTDSSGSEFTFDSDIDGNAFDFTTETAQVSDTDTGILIIKLQDAGSPPPAGDDYTANLIVYDTNNPDGIDWDSPFPLQVIDG